ncbi:hypothetical protein ACFQU7_17345 [Pseudoroseomonas wenyumeiae]
MNPRFTQWGQAEVPVVDGIAQLPEDGILMAVIHRHGLAPATPCSACCKAGAAGAVPWPPRWRMIPTTSASSAVAPKTLPPPPMR